MKNGSLIACPLSENFMNDSEEIENAIQLALKELEFVVYFVFSFYFTNLELKKFLTKKLHLTF